MSTKKMNRKYIRIILIIFLMLSFLSVLILKSLNHHVSYENTTELNILDYIDRIKGYYIQNNNYYIFEEDPQLILDFDMYRGKTIHGGVLELSEPIDLATVQIFYNYGSGGMFTEEESIHFESINSNKISFKLDGEFGIEKMRFDIDTNFSVKSFKVYTDSYEGNYVTLQDYLLAIVISFILSVILSYVKFVQKLDDKIFKSV